MIEPLLRDEAEQLCALVREQGQATLFSPDRARCHQCMHVFRGDPDLMLMGRRQGYRGCDLVNRLRARLERARTVRSA
ncbi:hypothetical protein ACFLUT_00290 [Chloroflexota bacterium]